MTYIYDVLLNFNKNLYEFFEWLDEDEIEYIKKIPVIKVKTKLICDIIDNDIKINDNFLDTISYKTKFYDEYIDKKYRYVCILSDGLISIGVCFKDNKTLYVSRMILDEERDVFLIVTNKKEVNINYSIIGKRKKSKLSRKELENQTLIKKEITNIYNNKQYDRLKYLYLEYFKEENNDNNYIFNRFINEINNNYNDKFINIINLINLSKI